MLKGGLIQQQTQLRVIVVFGNCKQPMSQESLQSEKQSVSVDVAQAIAKPDEPEDDANLTLEECAGRAIGLEMPDPEGQFDEEESRKIDRFKLMAKSLDASHITLIDECQDDEAILESIRTCSATVDAKQVPIKGDDKLNHVLIYYDQQEKWRPDSIRKMKPMSNPTLPGSCFSLCSHLRQSSKAPYLAQIFQ